MNEGRPGGRSPGMPYGSPGMGPESERDPYEVLLVARDGTSSVFARYD